MREIEVLVKLFDKKKDVLNVLGRFRHSGKSRVLDSYYFHPKLNILRPEKNGRLRECLRLRAEDGKYFIAYKKDYFNSHDVWKYSDEHETVVDSFEAISRILKHLGFKVLVKVDNTKHKFVHGDYEIVVEEVKGLGLFLEAEYKGNSRTDPEKIKEHIREFITSLGLRSEEVNMGKPEMLYRKKKKQ